MSESVAAAAMPVQPSEGHFVRFYREDATLLDEVADYVDAALRAGDAGVVIATPEHCAELAKRLQGFGAANSATPWYPGELVALDARRTLDAFMVDGWPDGERFFDVVGGVIARASQAGRRSVRAFGEMVALLCADGNHAAAVRLEELWNALARAHDFSLFCAYPIGLFSDAEHEAAFGHVCATHARVLPVIATGNDQSLPALAIAKLQQKAAALEAEVEKRRHAEQALVREREVLERATAERERLLEKLETASRAKDEFLAMLGHELRNPLAPIVTALQLMKMRGDTQTAKEQGIIQRQVDHLIRLVDDLLDVSKITRGKIELRKETVEIGSVLGKAIEMASLLLEQRRHRLVVHAPSKGLPWVGDPVRLAQVVANLLTNAARYTPSGGEVRLSAFRDTTHVVITVQDNGIGIAPEMLSRVFDLFVQGKRNVDRAEGGLGLGLALVKSLVRLHGGTVAARSAGLGRGSEFVVRLPLSEPNATPDPQPAEDPGQDTAQPPQTPAPMPNRRHVLIVDDNADAADLLGHVLRAHGHQVTVVHDPVAALRAVDTLRPDVAVLDIGLPVMDGYELAEQLRRKPLGRACCLVALTGYGQDADRSRSREAGFQMHLVKPVDLQKLVAVVEQSQAGAAAAP